MLRRGVFSATSFALRAVSKRSIHLSGRILPNSFIGCTRLGNRRAFSDIDPNIREAEIISDVEIKAGGGVRMAEMIANSNAEQENQSFKEYIGERDAEGRRHGKGKFTWDGPAHRNSYEGDFVEDVIQGKGVYTVDGKVLYEGDFERNMFHGVGKLRVKNALYEGQMFDNKMHGEGKMTYDSGAIYTGDFAKGKKYGQCVFQYPDGDVYEGGIDNDMMVGRGVLRYACGDVYDGDFANGKMNGRGVYIFNNGDTYVGEFANNEFHGNGRFKLSNGDFYEGTFTMGHKHGEGRMSYSQGDVYEGGWCKDKYDGPGVFRYADGRVEDVYHDEGKKIADYIAKERFVLGTGHRPKIDSSEQTEETWKQAIEKQGQTVDDATNGVENGEVVEEKGASKSS